MVTHSNSLWLKETMDFRFNYRFKKNWGPKFWGSKKVGIKKCWIKKCWGQKKLGSKICEVNKGLLGSTKVCDQTNFGTKKSGVVCNARGVHELWESEDPPWHTRYTTMQN